MKKAGSKASLKSTATASGAPPSADGPSPGHLGNLTVEQTSALAELWMHLLNLFAQPAETPVTSTKLPGSSQPPSPATSTTDLSVPTALNGGNTKVATVADVRRELWTAGQDQHPDPFVLRFLRARKFDVPKAYAMLVAALKWRVENDVQSVVEQGESLIDPSQFQGKAYFYKNDKVGRPVIYINARLHNKSAQSEAMLQRHTVYLMETARLVLPPGIETVTIVFNLTGFGLSNMDQGMVQFLVSCLQNYYPESLGTCLIVNAPWVFSGIWKIIKPWLDPVVQAKIFFAKSTELGQYIDEANLPADVLADPTAAGTYAFKYTEPTPAEIDAHRARLADRAKLESLFAARLAVADTLEAATREWATLWLAEYNPTALALLAGGSGHPHANRDEKVDVSNARAAADAKRAEIAQGPLVSTWRALDDYARFPSVWHRQGVLKTGTPAGTVDWSKALSANP
ncbi:hypothetical protein H9P43_008351 [Blastocladiella emersonii ATCC 22665]|nr:hypothetical protein H9P43_008351 [Blastocladiella emersonii ATCC 22665]